MKDANLIAAAVRQLDAKDDAQWESDKAPKLELIQKLMGDATVTVDDVQEAIGSFKRGDKLKVVASKDGGASNTPANTPAAASAATVPVDEPPLESLDPNGPEYADRIVRAARAEDAKLAAAIDDYELQREDLQTKIRQLTALRDTQVVLIEQYAPRVSHAQAVKAIQKQSQATLLSTRTRVEQARQMFGPTGSPVSYPSKLDASFAMRKRTPEQATNYAKFVHQTAQANTPPA